VRTQGAHFDLILGQWGDGASATRRWAVSLAFRQTAEGPQFMVVDAAGRPTADSDLVGSALRREEVLGTAIADQAFAVVDAVWLQDARLAELTQDAA
jgi:hypothetical protein